MASHIPKLTVPKKIVSLVKSLSSTPREIVHQILDDVPVSQVLLLASFSVGTILEPSYIDECILGHLMLQQLFTSQSALSAVRRPFILLYSLRTSLSFTRTPKTSPLSLNIRAFLTSGARMTLYELQVWLRTQVNDILVGVPEDRLNSLTEASCEPCDAKPNEYGNGDFQDCQTLFNKWQWIVAAQEKLNSSRAAELHKIADLYEAFPDLSKRSTDPSQKSRQNVQHIVAIFRSYARKVSNENWLRRTRYTTAPSIFNRNVVPLVPFDWCLRLFLRVMTRDIASFPTEIRHCIDISMAGMAYVYTTGMPPTTTSPNDIGEVGHHKISHVYANGVASATMIPSDRERIAVARAPRVPRTKITSDDFEKEHLLPPDLPLWIKEELRQFTQRGGHWQPLDHNVAGIFPSAPDFSPMEGRKKRAAYDKARKGPAKGPFAMAARYEDCWEPSHKHPVFREHRAQITWVNSSAAKRRVKPGQFGRD